MKKWKWVFEVSVEHGPYWRTARIRMKPLPITPSIGMSVSADSSGAMVPIAEIEVDCFKNCITLCGTITVDSDAQVDREIEDHIKFGWKLGGDSRPYAPHTQY